MSPRRLSSVCQSNADLDTFAFATDKSTSANKVCKRTVSILVHPIDHESRPPTASKRYLLATFSKGVWEVVPIASGLPPHSIESVDNLRCKASISSDWSTASQRNHRLVDTESNAHLTLPLGSRIEMLPKFEARPMKN